MRSRALDQDGEHCTEMGRLGGRPASFRAGYSSSLCDVLLLWKAYFHVRNLVPWLTRLQSSR